MKKEYNIKKFSYIVQNFPDFFILTIASELLFTYNNYSTPLGKTFFERMEKSSSANNTKGAMNYLLLATKLRINYQTKKYKNIVTRDDLDKYINAIFKSDYNDDIFLDYFKNIKYKFLHRRKRMSIY